MKKILRYSLIISLFATLASVTGCRNNELDVDPLGDSFTLNGLAPNPVMRGGSLLIYGRGLSDVSEVRFAGDVTVTDFIKISKGSRLDTLELIVPVEGPEVGKVTIVSKGGSQCSSMADLTFKEPIVIESFAPATVLSGDVLTITGEYLNVVKEVIFPGEDAYATEFEAQTRHELKVKVPANAITGPVILSDVNEIEDENTIPNHIYTQTDLTVGKPTVVKAAKATYKSGDVITVSGEHLDMIKNVALPQVASVDFTVSEDAKTISFNLDRLATDGNITLTSYAGDAFDAGEIETVSVTELAVKSLAKDGRYKAGVDVEITGKDLDLVTKVEFTGAEADWYLDGDKIIATQPDEAKDGAITVTLDSGKKVYSEDLVVVKPIIMAWDTVMTLTAGESILKIIGTDLDLTTSVKMGDKANGFIDCQYEFVVDDLGETDVKVSIPAQAYSGPIIFTSAAGYETESDPFVVEYNMAVSIAFDSPSFAMGKAISLTGENLLKIEQVYIKGKKVIDYTTHTNDVMIFGMPEGVGPGVYRLDVILTDGTQLTWPVPFEITAPYTETFYWEGSEDLGSWSNQPYLGADGALAGNIVVGDLIRIYYTPYASWWQFEIFDGHWGGMSFPELGGGNAVKADNADPDAKYFAFEVTDNNIEALTSSQGWGGIFVVQGESVIITGVSVIHFGSAKKYLWQGDIGPTNWDGNIIAEGVEGLDTLEPGMTMGFEFYVIDGAEYGQAEFMGTWWTQFPSLMYPNGDRHIWDFQPGETSIEFELTQADIDIMLQQGFLFVGNGGLRITGIYVL